MPSSRTRRLIALSLFGLFLEATPARAQRLEPEWVDISSPGKLVFKTLDVPEGKVAIRGGLVVRPGTKAMFLRAIAKPEGMVVELFLDVLNDSPNPLWQEMEIQVPSQEKEAVKLEEIKKRRGFRKLATVKDLQWGFPYPVKVTVYADKAKTSTLGTVSASLVFDESDRAKLEDAKAQAADGVRRGALPYITISGWPEKVTAPSADKTEAMVEGTLTEGQLRADVTKALKNVELVDRPHCEFAIVKQLHSPGNPGVEPWTAKTCDTTTTYRIVLIPSRRGGTDIAFSRVEPEGVQPRNAQPESEPGKGPVPPFEVEGI